MVMVEVAGERAITRWWSHNAHPVLMAKCLSLSLWLSLSLSAPNVHLIESTSVEESINSKVIESCAWQKMYPYLWQARADGHIVVSAREYPQGSVVLV